MLQTKTILAKVSSQFYPYYGQDAILVLDARGVDEEHIMVERGYTTDEEIHYLKDNFGFVKLIQGAQYYRIDKLVKTDNFQLINELISIPKNGTEG